MPDQPQPTLNTSRLVLRPFVLTDASSVQRLAGDQRVADMTEAIPHPYEDGMAETWIHTHARLWEAGVQVVQAVCLKSSGELVGCVGLELIRHHRRAALGYWTGVAHWGQGYCTEAASRLVAFGFNELRLHRIEAIHLRCNPASGAVLRKLGMAHEGTARDYVRKRGVFEDVERYALLGSDRFRNDGP